jgi:hypothetical protein
MADTDLRTFLETLDPKARDDLRQVLIRDQADRDAISSRLMRYRDQNGQGWADIIDFLTMNPSRLGVDRLTGLPGRGTNRAAQNDEKGVDVHRSTTAAAATQRCAEELDPQESMVSVWSRFARLPSGRRGDRLCRFLR